MPAPADNIRHWLDVLLAHASCASGGLAAADAALRTTCSRSAFQQNYVTVHGQQDVLNPVEHAEHPVNMLGRNSSLIEQKAER